MKIILIANYSDEFVYSFCCGDFAHSRDRLLITNGNISRSDDDETTVASEQVN